MEQTNAMCKYRYVGHTSTDWTYIQQKFLVVVLWAFWGGIVKMVTWNCFCNELATSTCTTQIKCALYLSHNLLAPTAIQICHNICAVWIMCMLNCLYRKYLLIWWICDLCYFQVLHRSDWDDVRRSPADEYASETSWNQVSEIPDRRQPAQSQGGQSGSGRGGVRSQARSSKGIWTSRWTLWIK